MSGLRSLRPCFASLAAALTLAVSPVGLMGTTAVAQPARASLLEYQTTLPSTWTSRTPSSSMRLAEYSTGGGAEVVVYFFGKGQGGSPDANLTRWKSQFTNPSGGPVQERVTRDTTGAFPVTIAEYRGTYARGVGTGSDASAALPDHVLIAVVAQTPRGTLFFQCYGPSAAVESQRAAYLKFATGLK
jgi:hypothetical protein